MSQNKNCALNLDSDRPRVLVVVSGGVAEFVADNGVDVEIFDWDNFDAGDRKTGYISHRFSDLAEKCGIPCNDPSTHD